mmetsp:Transcript_18648/g.33816  ORF Transcript_18648/g.33816 Transcript_18648/m.33816 type:complete len:247 (-) Transcript_18648:57-797(-)|eukprot:CAMPEP_0198293724 /NCGR_PEP_ID=MMETSP1449-20131203/18643_1 /TAXON_ID=420275 /ORGANISM="Attheya septentrionalis, Strain CCMP2084" /LENGTH=246 /DNA_ID=CAMNT_0043993423 /DNA_START=77 /DNA_END=817 /DNA_ORIENTATION=-
MLYWAAVTRNEVVLAEAGGGGGDGFTREFHPDQGLSDAITKLAQKILQMKPTAGWEFCRGSRSLTKTSRNNLHAVKFHFHERADLMWTFICVHDSTQFPTADAKMFLEKIMILTEPLRITEDEWRVGGTLACQDSFAPILFQQMQLTMDEINGGGNARIVALNNHLDETKFIMSQNIDLLLSRGETLEELQMRSDTLTEMSKQFKKQSKKVKRFKMIQNAKHGVMVGTAITAGAAIIIIPPIIALL